MPIVLGDNCYGKSRVRVMRVERRGDCHAVDEWKVEVWLKGDFRSCFEEGDNSRILPTDTMKNTVYVLARETKAANAEEFAEELTAYLVQNNPQVTQADVTIESTPWLHIVTGGKEHGTAFVQTGAGIETSAVRYVRGGKAIVRSGFRNLAILKTAGSGFAGYIKDRLTTLRETHDRLLGTLASAEWTYSREGIDHSAARRRMMDALLNTFATHDSLSVQQTLYAMGKAALETEPGISEIHLSMPNRHCNLVDLTAFGLENPNHIFVPTDEPHGSIEARVRRAD
jgi:urate oxidase